MIDVVLAVLPVTIFYGLALGFRRKLGLSVLLGLGLIAAICGIIKTKFLAALNARSDLTCTDSFISLTPSPPPQYYARAPLTIPVHRGNV